MARSIVEAQQLDHGADVVGPVDAPSGEAVAADRMLDDRVALAASAPRFYEERDLIASERAGSGHRRYPRRVLRRIAFIVFAQKVGMTLGEIGEELAKLPPDTAPKRADWSRLSSGWSARIDERIEELERLKRGLTECNGCGCLSHGSLQARQPRDRGGQYRARDRATGSATGRPTAGWPDRAPTNMLLGDERADHGHPDPLQRGDSAALPCTHPTESRSARSTT